MKYFLISSELSEAFENVIMILIIFGAVMFATAIIISVWKIVEFFNRPNKMAKNAAATQESVNKIKEKNKQKKNKKKNTKKLKKKSNVKS